jgi:2-dehydro-3-deoxyphosphogluconate aldolase/(4S)-4-hydroxy-2-oxoglutarate aldolase
MRTQTIKTIEKEKLIVIVRGVEREFLIPLAEAMYTGGIRLLEITYDASGKIADEETADRIAMLSAHFGERMLIGAGTVLTEKQAELTKRAGGRFIISPNTDENVIKKTRVLEMVSIPGALTPTEVQTAHLAGQTS